jgi:hypothetical protein
MPHSCQILIVFELSRQISASNSNIKCHKYPSSGCRTAPCGRQGNMNFSQFCARAYKGHNKTVVLSDRPTLFHTGFAFRHDSVLGNTRKYPLQKEKRVGRLMQFFKNLIKAISFQKNPDP